MSISPISTVSRVNPFTASSTFSSPAPVTPPSNPFALPVQSDDDVCDIFVRQSDMNTLIDYLESGDIYLQGARLDNVSEQRGMQLMECFVDNNFFSLISFLQDHKDLVEGMWNRLGSFVTSTIQEYLA